MTDQKNNSIHAINPVDIKDNPIEMFHKDWAVVAAGSKEDFNEMTVSWGAIGAGVKRIRKSEQTGSNRKKEFHS